MQRLCYLWQWPGELCFSGDKRVCAHFASPYLACVLFMWWPCKYWFLKNLFRFTFSFVYAICLCISNNEETFPGDIVRFCLMGTRRFKCLMKTVPAWPPKLGNIWCVVYAFVVQ